MPIKTVNVVASCGPNLKDLNNTILYHAAFKAAGANKTLFRGRVILNIQVYPPQPELPAVRPARRRPK